MQQVATRPAKEGSNNLLSFYS